MNLEEDKRDYMPDEEEEKQSSPSKTIEEESKMPLKRKLTRKDSIVNKVRSSMSTSSALTKLRNCLAKNSGNLDSLMGIFTSHSYKQNIKSKSRQSETLVIQKNDFYNLLNQMIQNESAQTSDLAAEFS